MARVLMQVTGKLDEAKWQCEACGRWLAYSQPISFSHSLALVKVFKEAHEDCKPNDLK